MTGQPKELGKFASLSSGLLARKGDARPAMRRPSGAAPHGVKDQAADLGWNDFGHDDEAETGTDARPAETQSPIVLKQQRRIAETFRNNMQSEARDEANVAAAVPERSPRTSNEQDNTDIADAEAIIRPVMREFNIKAQKRNGRSIDGGAAFTLRLDAERHLRLRLACTVKNKSAQRLVTEALDRFLSDMSEIDGLMAKIAVGEKEKS